MWYLYYHIMILQCPGARRFKQPQPEAIKCPSCGWEVEIWTDEVKVTCPWCNAVILRQQEQSCLDWCRYAKECVGEQLYRKYLQNKRLVSKE